MMKRDCDFVLRQVAGVPSLDSLSPLVSWRLLLHIAGCKSCARTYFQMQKMEHAARALYANVEPTPQFVSRVEEQLTLLPANQNPSRRALPRHEKKDKKMQRSISFAVAFCAALSVLYVGLRGKPAPAARDVLLQMQTALVQNQTVHVATYAAEVEESTTGTMTSFGRLTKMGEWWNAGSSTQRVETPFFPDLVDYAAGKRQSVRRRGIIYAGGTKWEFAPDTQNRVVRSAGGMQTPMGWKTYSLEQLAGDDNTGLRESIITDGGTRQENHQTIRTIIVERKGLSDGPRWVCQIDANTNLPVRFDDTNKRGGQWFTTIRYDFEFNHTMPATLFDPQTLQEAPPTALSFPFIPTDAADIVPPKEAAQLQQQLVLPESKDEEQAKNDKQTQNSLAPFQTAHLCFYALEEGGKSGVSFGKLTKVEEWWKSGAMMRQETPYYQDLIALAGKSIVPDRRHWRTIYGNTDRWQYSPETGQVNPYPNDGAETRHPIGLKGFGLEQLAGDDNMGLRESTVSDGGTRTENGQAIHTLIVKRNGAWGADGPVWVCQMDAKTNLPIRVEDTNKRNGKWITTMRYDFEFNRPLPASLFDPKVLHNAPPAAFTFPNTR